VNSGRLELAFCISEFKQAYILTKPLEVEGFKEMRNMLGVPFYNLYGFFVSGLCEMNVITVCFIIS